VLPQAHAVPHATPLAVPYRQEEAPA
jgi:hypothetical protein